MMPANVEVQSIAIGDGHRPETLGAEEEGEVHLVWSTASCGTSS